MIPLRPELVEFMDPRSLCRYACTSKTLCKDVRDLKAWDLLAIAQCRALCGVRLRSRACSLTFAGGGSLTNSGRTIRRRRFILMGSEIFVLRALLGG